DQLPTRSGVLVCSVRVCSSVAPPIVFCRLPFFRDQDPPPVDERLSPYPHDRRSSGGLGHSTRPAQGRSGSASARAGLTAPIRGRRGLQERRKPAPVHGVGEIGAGPSALGGTSNPAANVEGETGRHGLGSRRSKVLPRSLLMRQVGLGLGAPAAWPAL